MESRVISLLRLVRVEHSIMLVVAVIAAELIVGFGILPNAYVLVLSLLSPALISAGAFAINDYYDVESDRANKRFDRPLVGGLIKKSTAMSTAVLCFFIGVIASALMTLPVFIVALVFAALAFLYSYRLKDMLLVGNLYVAGTYAIPFIYGSFVVSGSITLLIVLICFVTFLSGLAREIHGMVRDRAGDIKERKSNNVVRNIGVKHSLYIAFILYFEAIAISVFLFFYALPFRFNAVYVIPITLANLLLFYVAAAPMYKPDSKILKFGRNVSLIGMTIALFAYLFSAIFYLPLVP